MIFIETFLADLFDPKRLDTLGFVSKKIVDLLIENKIIKNDNLEVEETIIAS